MRRPTLRALGLLAVALSAITCTDAPTAPGTFRGVSPARLGIAPSFSPTATRAYTTLTELGIAVTNVRIRLTGASGAVVLDTVVAFPANVDSMSIELPIQIQGTEQSFTAVLELRDASGTVLFSHTQLVTARASSLPAVPTTQIVLEYVGPGHATRTVTVSPTNLTLAPGVPRTVTATAVDSAGQAIADLLVTWTSSDTSIATVVPTAPATATVTGTGRRGAVTITATTPTGVAGTARFTLLPQPARIVVVSGNAQTGVAGHPVPLPVVLELQGVDGGPIANSVLVLTAVTAGASVGSLPGDTLLTTDSTGRASALLTLGRTAGSYAYSARIGTITSAAITATATAAPAAALAIVAGDAQVDSVGRVLPQLLAVRATDEFGARVAGATVTWTRAGAGTLGAATSTTDTAGVARVAYTLGSTVRTDTIRAALGTATTGAGTATFTARAIAGSAAKLAWVQEAPDTVVVGAPFPPISARLTDAAGNAVRTAGVKVLIHGRGPATPGDSNTYSDSTLTDTAGIARVVIPSYEGVAGQLTLTLASPGLDSLTKQIVARAGAAAKLAIVSGMPATAASGVAFAQPVVVQVTDAGGNAIAANVTVSASVVGPGASLGGPTSVTTGSDGRATFAALVINGVAGSYRLQFDAPSLTSAIGSPIALTGGVASALEIASGNGQAGTVGTLLAGRPTVRVIDANGNPVRTGRVVFSARNGSAVSPDTVPVDSNGLASTGWTLGAVAGSDTLVAHLENSSIPPVTFTASATAGAASRFEIVAGDGQSATVSSSVPQAPSVRAMDAQGNGVSGIRVVFRSITPGATLHAGTVTGDSVEVLTNAAGVATLGAWTLGSTAGTYTLEARSVPAIIGNALGFTATATPGAAARFVTTASSLAPVAGQPVTVQAQLVDAAGNEVRAAGHAVAWSASVAGGTFSAATTPTDSNGTARASYTTPTAAGTTVVLTATEGSVTGSTPAITTVAGTGALLGFEGGWLVSGTTASGAAFAPQPVVQLLDANGNPVRIAGVSVSAAVTSGPTTPSPVLSGATATTDASGRAVFTALAITGLAGDYTLGFAATGYASLGSSSVTIGAGGVSHLAFSTQPPSSTTAGAPFDVAVSALDASGNVVPSFNGSVTVGISSGTGLAGATLHDSTFAQPLTRTAVNGVATFTRVAIDSAAPGYTLAATATSVSGATSTTVNIVPGVATQLAISGPSPTSVASGAALSPQPAVQFRDAHGNAVALQDVRVTASIASGTGTLNNVSVFSDATGRAAFTSLKLTGPAGSVTITYTASGYASATSAPIAITAGAASQLALLTPPSATAASRAVFAQQPVVQLQDASGNPVHTAGVSVSVILTSAGGILGGTTTVATDSLGQAVYSGLAITGAAHGYGMDFTATGLASTSAGITVIAGAGTQVTITTHPTSASSGAVLAPQPVVQLRDADGNPVALAGVTVTATIASGAATLTNATAVTTASGAATFSGLTLSGTAGSVTLAYAATGYSSAVSAPVDLGAGAPGQLAIETAPTSTIASGATFPQPPVIQLQDASGNSSTEIGVSVSVSITNGTGTLIGPVTGTSDALGRVTFTGLGIRGTTGSFTLTFSASGLTPTTAVVTVTAGAPAAIAVAAGDGQAGPRGGLVAIPPKAFVHDAEGNAVPGASVVFTAITPNDSVSAGTLGRTATVATNALGEAALTAWKLGTTQYDTVVATVGSFSVTFAATSTIGAATHFVVVSGGGQSGMVTTVLPQQVVIEARDANEQPVAGTALAINYSFATDQGFIRLDGVNYDCECTPRDSVLTDANGRAALGWQLSYHAKVDSIYVKNDAIAQTLITATAVAGPAANLVFDTPGGLDDDAANVLNTFRVFVSDIGGYDTLRVSGNITLELRRGGLGCEYECPPVPGTSGSLSAQVINGIATFPGISISSPGSELYFFATYDQAPSAYGYSDQFDISPAGPHFVEVGSHPADVAAGTAVQIRLRSQDAHGNPLPNESILVSRGDFNGSVNLTGGAYGGFRDSARTDINGLITLTWTMPPEPQTGLMVTISNYQTYQALYVYANSVVGPPSRIVTNLDGGLDDDVNDVLNPFDVFVTDAAYNHVTSASGTVTVTLVGGDPGAQLGGTTSAALVDGSARFDNLTIDRVGASYKLVFTANGGAWTGETAPFDISPASVPPVATVGVVGRPQFLLAPNGTSALQVIAKDAGGTPVANQHVIATSYSPGVCWVGSPGVDHEGAFTDGTGVATVTVHGTLVNGGCFVRLQVDNNGSSFLVAFQGSVYAGTATHVWVPTDGGRFEVDSSWVRRSDGAPVVPGASDRIYIARDGAGGFPVLFGPRALAGVEMESGTQFELGGYALTVTGDVNSTNAIIQDGPVIVRGRSSVTGTVADLSLGIGDGCAGEEFTLQNVNTYQPLRVRCRTIVGVNVTADSLVVYPGAKLVMAGPGSSFHATHADVQGDSLTLDGQFELGSISVLRPLALSMRSTAYLRAEDNLQIGDNGNGSVALAGRVYVGGDFSQQGIGTSVADTITVLGNASWAGGRFELTRGVLDVARNLLVGADHSQDQFMATGDHLTHFSGSAPQFSSMTYASEGSEYLARVRVSNPAGVTIQTDIRGGSTDTVAVELAFGAQMIYNWNGVMRGHLLLNESSSLTLNNPVTLASPWALLLGSFTTLTVNSTFSGTCLFNGDGFSGPTVSGTGTINGSPPSPAACGYVPSQ